MGIAFQLHIKKAELILKSVKFCLKFTKIYTSNVSLLYVLWRINASHLLNYIFTFLDQFFILAAKIAGFNRVELLNQSTAITMAYRYEFSEKTGNDEMATCENVLVLSVGAQTTEVFIPSLFITFVFIHTLFSNFEIPFGKFTVVTWPTKLSLPNIIIFSPCSTLLIYLNNSPWYILST